MTAHDCFINIRKSTWAIESRPQDIISCSIAINMTATVTFMKIFHHFSTSPSTKQFINTPPGSFQYKALLRTQYLRALNFKDLDL